ncbi:MAG: WecB/TagA/CpsF family glycosyltransferase [Myxococcota bacterium]
MQTVDLLGCPVGVATHDGWVEALAANVASGAPHHHVSLNAAKWVAMREDRSLRRAVRAATSVAADGASIVLASRWLGHPVPARVTGCDLALALMALAPARGWRVYLLGATPPVATEVARRVRADGVAVVGARHGFFGPDDEPAVARAIADARPDLVLVALGTPRAELFCWRWVEAPLAMGVGGTFDVIAGTARRAPDAVGRAGLEWAWRFAHQPRTRFRRAIVDPARFAAAVAAGARLPAG